MVLTAFLMSAPSIKASNLMEDEEKENLEFQQMIPKKKEFFVLEKKELQLINYPSKTILYNSKISEDVTGYDVLEKYNYNYQINEKTLKKCYRIQNKRSPMSLGLTPKEEEQFLFIEHGKNNYVKFQNINGHNFILQPKEEPYWSLKEDPSVFKIQPWKNNQLIESRYNFLILQHRNQKGYEEYAVGLDKEKKSLKYKPVHSLDSLGDDYLWSMEQSSPFLLRIDGLSPQCSLKIRVEDAYFQYYQRLVTSPDFERVLNKPKSVYEKIYNDTLQIIVFDQKDLNKINVSLLKPEESKGLFGLSCKKRKSFKEEKLSNLGIFVQDIQKSGVWGKLEDCDIGQRFSYREQNNMGQLSINEIKRKKPFINVEVGFDKETHNTLKKMTQDMTKMSEFVCLAIENGTLHIKEGVLDLSQSAKDGTFNVRKAIENGTLNLDEAMIHLGRAVQDGTLNLSRAIENGTFNLKEAINDGTINLKRAVQDGTLNLGKAIQDGTLNLSRAIENGTFNLKEAVNDGTINLKQAVQDGTLNLGKAVQDGTLNLGRAIENGTFNLKEAVNDGTINLKQAVQDGTFNLGLGMNEIAKGIENGTINLKEAIENGTFNIKRGVESGSLNLKRGIENGTFNIRQGMEDGSFNLKRGIENGTFNIRRGIEDGSLNLKRGIENGTFNIKQGIENGSLNLKKGIENGTFNIRQGIEDGSLNLKRGIENGTFNIKQGIENGSLNMKNGMQLMGGALQSLQSTQHTVKHKICNIF